MAWLTLAVLALGGCHRAASAPPTAPAQPAAAQAPEPVAIPSGSRAVVRAGARVYFDDARTRRWSLPPAMPGGGLAVVVQGEHDGVLALQLDTQSPCAPASTRDFQLQLFAARGDLATITTRALEHTLADGRRVRVHAGVVVPQGNTIVLASEGRTIGVPVPADATGDAAPAAAADDDAACVSLQTAAGPGSVELVDPSADALRAARLAVASGPPVIVAAGARIWSRDGHDAGVVAREHGFDTPIAVAGARTCLALPVAVGDELPLCFDARDLRNAPTVAPVPLGARRIVGKLRQPKPSVGGGLDRDIVRRIVRAHLNEVRHCYNQVLASDASLVGKIAVHFTIDADGSVFDSNVASASPGTEAVAECAASVVRRWLFPRTESGAAVPVTQAFELQGV